MTPPPPPAATSVPTAFDDVAGTYDLMVALSPGYHHQLRASARVLVDALAEGADRIGGAGGPDGPPLRLLDLGCGSGASTAALVGEVARRGLRAEIVGVDGSAGMLARARGKDWPSGVRFTRLDAETLTAGDLREAAGGPVDGVLAAYLVRNVEARDRLLGAIHDALAADGTVVLHEYAVRGDALATASWTAVCWGVIVPLGLATAPRSGIYRYLWRSVLRFDSVRGLRDRMSAAGLVDVRSRTFTGLPPRTVHTFVGRRGPAPAHRA